MKKKNDSAEASPVGPDDFRDADLGDKRRTERVYTFAQAMGAAPDRSLPELTSSRSELNAVYRMLGNEHFEDAAVFEAHAEKTYARVLECEEALSVQDTTTFAYNGHGRDGLGKISAKEHGFFGHFALAVRLDGRPLGVLAIETWCRDGTAKPKGYRRTKEFKLGEERESKRWPRVIGAVAPLFEPSKLIHVMDREGDTYEVFAALKNLRFAVRVGSTPRNVEILSTEERVHLRDAIDAAATVFERPVRISERRKSPYPHQAKIHPPRDERVAKLVYASMRVRLIKPRNAPHLADAPDGIEVNLVYVRERDAPADEDPIEWLIATSEPIETEAQVQRVVDIYRARWVIEEFFKALKTGCAVEKRQLETLDALIRCMIITLPIACRMLALRTVARSEPKAPASTVLTQVEVDVLRRCGHATLPRRPTARDCLLAVAQWGGHQKNNGEPGWLTLARGMKRLADAVVVWEAAFQAALARSGG